MTHSKSQGWRVVTYFNGQLEQEQLICLKYGCFSTETVVPGCGFTLPIVNVPFPPFFCYRPPEKYDPTPSMCWSMTRSTKDEICATRRRGQGCFHLHDVKCFLSAGRFHWGQPRMTSAGMNLLKCPYLGICFNMGPEIFLAHYIS